jgi:hypothetical protein
VGLAAFRSDFVNYAIVAKTLQDAIYGYSVQFTCQLFINILVAESRF